MGVQLAYYEANSAALLGDQHRAQQALQRADQFADALRDLGAVGSPWAFPAERRAIFQLSVLLRTGDPAGALIAAQDADHGWQRGDPYIPSTWAQVRIGAAIAHLQRGSLVACRCLVLVCLVARLVSGSFLPLCQTGLPLCLRR
jgi:hypothetical protein